MMLGSKLSDINYAEHHGKASVRTVAGDRRYELQIGRNGKAGVRERTGAAVGAVGPPLKAAAAERNGCGGRERSEGAILATEPPARCRLRGESHWGMCRRGSLLHCSQRAVVIVAAVNVAFLVA